MRAWVTGAAGSIGSALMENLTDAVGTDLDVDITKPDLVFRAAERIKPDVIFHCAAEKHAPEGELDPVLSAAVNIDGTRHLLNTGVRVVLASTCKAADPETVYGAVKLVAERMVLNAGGSVARFYNVVESSGNVFRKWADTLDPEPIQAMPCYRYFLHIDQAVTLMETVSRLPSGRYTADPGPAVYIPDLAESLYPGRVQLVSPRRGDRIREPLHAQTETLERFGWLMRIISPYDPPMETQ